VSTRITVIKGLVVSTFFCGIVHAQQAVPPPAQCPVLSSLASSKVKYKDEEKIVIWFWNQGTKTTHGIEFQLILLDAAGNHYPASQRYIATGDTKPNTQIQQQEPKKPWRLRLLTNRIPRLVLPAIFSMKPRRRITIY